MKTIKIEKTVAVRCNVPEQLSLELDEMLLELKKKGRRKSKACLIIELAILGVMTLNK